MIYVHEGQEDNRSLEEQEQPELPVVQFTNTASNPKA